MYDLMDKVYKFIERCGNPKINIVWLADTILTRLKNDLDYFINAEGFKGYGKSNLMLLIALIQCRYAGLWKNKETGKVVKVLPRTTPLPPPWEHIEISFSFSKNMSFLDDSKAIKDKFNSLDKYMPLIIDEGSKNLHKYNWQNKMQFMLVQLSDTERYQNKSVFVCFPNFRELNPVFRNDRIMMRLYLYHRNAQENYSSCIISLRDVNRYVIDPWHTDLNAKDFEYLLRKTPTATRTARSIISAERKLKGYAGDFEVPSLRYIAPKIWKIYYTYKTENAKREYGETDGELPDSKNVTKWKYTLKNIIKYLKDNNPDMTMKQIAEICKSKPSIISTLMTTELPQDKVDKIEKELIAEKEKEEKAFYDNV